MSRKPNRRRPGTEQPPSVFSGVGASEQEEAKQTAARYRVTATFVFWSVRYSEHKEFKSVRILRHPFYLLKYSSLGNFQFL